jgi:hypothetical protein
MKPVLHCLLLTVALLAVFVPTLSAGEPSGSSPYSWITGEDPHPFLGIVYGIDWPRHKRLEAEFPSIGALELKGGYLYVDTLKNGVVTLGEAFIMGGWYNDGLGGGTGGTEGLSGSLGRFGLGYGQGYGYALKNAVIVPYFVSGVNWTKLSTDRPETLGETDNDILDRYEGTFRFGLSAESGIRANIGQKFSLSGGYEANIIYPRFVFWEWLGSYAIVGAANGVVSFFSADMLDNSPTLGPIMVFALRTAIAWGFYQLLREEMNWPFNSETPLTHETLKFGVTFIL